MLAAADGHTQENLQGLEVFFFSFTLVLKTLKYVQFSLHSCSTRDACHKER